MSDFRSTGAYRHHYQSTPTASSRQEKFKYEMCSSCQGIFQSLELENGRMGLGSYSRRHRTETNDEIIESNRRNEQMRRSFRSMKLRCKCSTLGDQLFIGSESGLGEIEIREKDFLKPNLPDDGWYVDPTALHKLRFWNGASWTNWVSDDGTTAQTTAPVFPLDWTELLPGEKIDASSRIPSFTNTRKTVKSSKNLTSQLAELSQLYNSGALTKEQFEAAKNSLLGL